MTARFAANLLWLLSTLPDYLRFRVMLHFPGAAQRRTRRRRSEAACRRVILYEPTSGSTGGTKWIPYTPLLQQEFLRAINPWIAAIYFRHLGLLFRTHYWSLSPATRVRPPDLPGRYGFQEDREYLSPLQRRVTQTLFAVPAALRAVADPERHVVLTLLYLVADRHLGLISVWHPSFLLILLQRGNALAAEIAAAIRSGDWGDGRRHRPDARRAAVVGRCLVNRNYRELWPRLVFISCWDQARAAADARTLRALFPGVEVEGKGLLATEGIVTIPWGRRHKVAAIRSHSLYFRPWHGVAAAAAAELLPLTAVAPGREYTVYLAGGNGFTAYPLGDVVRCTGYVGRTPCFDFLYRSGGVSDLHGEKLHTAHVECCIADVEARYGLLAFAMLTPNRRQSGYYFLYDAACPLPSEAAELLEAALCDNYYYRHTRAAGQLAPVRLRRLRNAMARYRRHQTAAAGAVKNPPLYLIAATDCGQSSSGREKKIENSCAE